MSWSPFSLCIANSNLVRLADAGKSHKELGPRTKREFAANESLG
jgi:hypothetical protein